MELDEQPISIMVSIVANRNDNVSGSLTTRIDESNNYFVADTIKIKTANSTGYIEANEGDGIDISSRMEYHRGTVQKGMSHTLNCMGGENEGVVINGRSESNSRTR